MPLDGGDDSGLTVRMADWFEPFLHPARYKSLSGGRGSSKSHHFAQMAVLRMAHLLPWYPTRTVRIASARQFQNSIAESVKTTVEHYIGALGLAREFDCQKYVINHVNSLGEIDGHMWFPGFNRHPESLMSTEAMDVLWIEQAETIGEEMEKIIPSVRADGSELWFSWNPNERAQWCWRRFRNQPRPDDCYAHINYNQNPWWFPHCQACKEPFEFKAVPDVCPACGREEIAPGLWELEEERRAMEAEEPDRYAHVWLGMPDDADAGRQVLTYTMLADCVKAWKLGLHKRATAVQQDMGLDVAEGGADKCAQVIRIGPTVEFLDMWPGVAGDLSVCARHCHDNVVEGDYDIYRLYYDASSPMRREFIELDVDYGIWPINFGGKVGGPERPYEARRKNEDVFRSRNIQMADALRLRANRTVRLLKGDESIDPDECLFIRADLPRLEDFLTDCTQPIRRRNPITGKWELDKRGGDEKAESPDRFDALCLAYARDSDQGLRAR